MTVVINTGVPGAIDNLDFVSQCRICFPELTYQTFALYR